MFSMTRISISKKSIFRNNRTFWPCCFSDYGRFASTICRGVIMLRGYNGSDVFMIPPPTEPRTSLCEIYHSNTNIDSQSHLPATWLLRIYNIRYIRLIVSMRPCVYMSTGPCHVSLCPRVHFMCLYVHESMSCVFMSTSPFHVSVCP